MTRLETLCRLHNVYGGTIHQYNKIWYRFGNLLDLDDRQWKQFILHVKMNYDKTELMTLILKQS